MGKLVACWKVSNFSSFGVSSLFPYCWSQPKGRGEGRARLGLPTGGPNGDLRDMTYTFKLSRRLSLSHWSPMCVLIALVVGCSSSDLTTTGPDAQMAEARPGSGESIRGESNVGKGRGRRNRDSSQTVVKIAISPDPATVQTTGSTRFVATGVLSDGSKVSTRVTWSATGGKIDSTGFYVAGSVTGKYRVLAKSLYTELVDTSAVTVTTEVSSVTAVTISPSSVTLASGASQHFTASARLSDGTSQSTNITYQATGGTIDPSGLYTAGSTGGAYRVVAASSGKADTSLVTITASSSPSTVAGCPASGYLRLVNVSTPSQLQAALAASLPGDQIRLAAGTYSYSSGAAIVMDRSGTASNPITVCGPRTAVTRGGIWRVDYPTKYWTLKGFKIDGNATGFTGVWDQGGGRNIYDSLEVTNTTQEGIMIKGASSPNPPSVGNVIRNNYIHHVGVTVPKFGECIYIGDGNDHTKRVDSTHIHHNTVSNCPAEGIELKTGAHGSLVEFNTVTTTAYDLETYPSAVEIRGNGNRVNDNVVTGSGRFLFEVFADHVSGGLYNTFRRNRGADSGNDKMFNKNTNDGSPLTGNVFYCDNTAVAPTIDNINCTQ